MKKIIVAMRGRYDKNKKIRQHLEPRTDNLCNTITSVQKDNLVLEIYGNSKDKTSNQTRVD